MPLWISICLLALVLFPCAIYAFLQLRQLGTATKRLEQACSPQKEEQLSPSEETGFDLNQGMVSAFEQAKEQEEIIKAKVGTPRFFQLALDSLMKDYRKGEERLYLFDTFPPTFEDFLSSEEMRVFCTLFQVILAKNGITSEWHGNCLSVSCTSFGAYVERIAHEQPNVHPRTD